LDPAKLKGGGGGGGNQNNNFKMKKIKTHELLKKKKKKTPEIRMNYKSPKIKKKNPQKKTH
jgi:hypothetical protein